jgi:dUTP pyrophosphatase
MFEWLSQMKFTPQPFQPQHAPALQFYKTLPAAFDPIWGTDHAACFDLKACLVAGSPVTIYSAVNDKLVVHVLSDGSLFIMPGYRAMIPTGLIFDIPLGYSVRLHSRSGLALKQGIVLANHEGVVDSDYVDPTMVVLKNDSSVVVQINHGDRIAQAEMVTDIAYEVLQSYIQPTKKSDRSGGFGSTGI